MSADLLVATSNGGKLAEIREILAGAPLRLVSLAEWPGIPAPEEHGTTFEQNARSKALYYALATGLPAVAEDSGLEVQALDGAPGVLSARFAGEGTSYEEKFERLNSMLHERGAAGSAARFVCALALVRRRTVLFEAQGVVDGYIAPAPRGAGGFGYDPIFFYPPFGCTLAEVPQAQKATVSHRGRAFGKLAEYLRQEPRALGG